MSYILEALRRAETERERKRRVPGLHAQPVLSPSTEESSLRRNRPWLWVVVGLSAGVLLAFLWQWSASDPAAEEAAIARASVVGNVTPQAGAGSIDSVSANPASTAAAANAAATPLPATEPASASHAPRATAKPAATPKAGTGAKPEPVTRAPAMATAPQAANPTGATSNQSARPSVPTAPAPTSAPEPRLRTLNELPEDLRRNVPTLAFGGSVYSETAAQRMVIFNGQVLREGDSLTDELLLEQIRPRSAVLRLRGQRFEVVF